MNFQEQSNAHRALAKKTGLNREVLARAGVPPTATVAEAERIVRGKVGPEAWDRAVAQGGLGGQVTLLRALGSDQPTTKTKAVKVENIDAEGEPMPCDTCGHDSEVHPKDGPCREDGCTCKGFVMEGEDPKEAPTPKRDESTARRIGADGKIAIEGAVSRGVDRGRATAAHRALFAGETPKASAAPSAKALRAQRAKELGVDPVAYENSHRALFPGEP